MSQKKVDAYKEQKKNRKQIIAKEKRIKVVKRILYSVIGVAVVLYLGWSVYRAINPAEQETYTPSAEEYQSLLNEIYASTTTAGETTTAAGETTAEGETTKENETTVGELSSDEEATTLN